MTSPSPYEHALTARDGIDRFLGKLVRREPARIVYFGTSVTTAGWPDHVTQWLKARYPDAPLSIVNSSIGGTASDLAVFRVGRDVIAHRPDLVFAEFCNDVNVGGVEEVAFQLDGILGQIRGALPACDVIVVHVARQTYTEIYARDECPPHILRHEEAAGRHGVPSIHASRVVARSIAEGRLAWTDYGADIIHPNAAGQRLLAEIVCAALARLESAPKGAHPLPLPLNQAYTRTRLAPLGLEDLRVADGEQARTAWARRLDSGALTRDWPERVDYYHRYFKDFMPAIWMLAQAGDTLRHEFNGTIIGLYDLVGPDSGFAAVRVDGQDLGIFDRSWNGNIYRLSNGVIFTRKLSPGRHTVEVTLLDKRPPAGLPPVLLPGFWMEG